MLSLVKMQRHQKLKRLCVETKAICGRMLESNERSSESLSTISEEIGLLSESLGYKHPPIVVTNGNTATDEGKPKASGYNYRTIEVWPPRAKKSRGNVLKVAIESHPLIYNPISTDLDHTDLEPAIYVPEIMSVMDKWIDHLDAQHPDDIDHGWLYWQESGIELWVTKELAADAIGCNARTIKRWVDDEMIEAHSETGQVNLVEIVFKYVTHQLPRRRSRTKSTARKPRSL